MTKTDEIMALAAEPANLLNAVNSLLHQIDIADFVDSHGHSAKMLKPVHDLMRLVGNAEPAKLPENCGTGHCSCIECVKPAKPSGEREALILDLRSYIYDSPTANAVMRLAADMLAADAKDAFAAGMACRPASVQQVASSTLPERDASRPAEQQGLFRKFVVQRTDGSDKLGGKHHGCEYFVLDVDHDPHTKVALRAYAAACAQSHPLLSADLIARHGAQQVAVPQVGMRDVTYRDSTPLLSVGNSAFEDWFQAHEKACTGDKQLARDAYAAGMGDPLVTYASPQPPQADHPEVELSDGEIYSRMSKAIDARLNIRVPMTDDEIYEAWDEMPDQLSLFEEIILLARAIEQLHGIGVKP